MGDSAKKISLRLTSECYCSTFELYKSNIRTAPLIGIAKLSRIGSNE